VSRPEATDAAEKENEGSSSSSSSSGSQEGSAVSGDGESGVCRLWSMGRESFLFFEEDVLTVSCPGSSGNSSSESRRHVERHRSPKGGEHLDETHHGSVRRKMDEARCPMRSSSDADRTRQGNEGNRSGTPCKVKATGGCLVVAAYGVHLEYARVFWFWS
jgi:hypothetical protein